MPSFPEPQQPLTDGAVTVRLSEERDIPEILIAYQDDPGLTRALGEGRPPTGAALGRRSEHARDDMRDGRAVTFTILHSGSDACRGEVRVAGVDWRSGRARLQVWVVPRLRGGGLARRGQALVRDWLAEECGLTAECSPPEAGDGAAGPYRRPEGES